MKRAVEGAMSMENVNNMFASGVETVAQMSVGQAVLRIVDRILYVIEKSIQWSLPVQEVNSDENGKAFGKMELVRPLPWIFFLPGLLILRLVRFGINATGNVLGYPEVQPSDMIHVVQRGRRRLRAIKSSGLKNMRLKKMPTVKDRAISMKEATKSLAKSIRLTLSTLSCLDSGSKISPSPPPTKICVSSILDGGPVSEEKPWQETSPTTDSKRKYSELSSGEESEDEPLLAKIDRLANLGDESDDDFSLSHASSSGSSESSVLSNASEADVSIPLSELHDIKNEQGEWERVSEEINCKRSRCIDILHKEKDDTVEKVVQNILENKPDDTEVEKTFSATNGINTDADTAYYSPISWKSISPEPIAVPEKDDTPIDGEEKSEEVTNGELNNGDKESNEDDSSKPPAEGEDVINGHMKEKQKISSSNGNNKSYKNKRGTHGNRKKK